MSSLPRVIVKARRARPLFARHPWLFVTSIAKVEGKPEPGAEVEVFTHDGQFIARGLFNPKSAIQVRLYRWDGGPLDDEFWTRQLQQAIQLRHQALALEQPGAGYRLVSGEGDGLSGLVVDRYDQWLVVQFSCLGLFQRREHLLKVLNQAIKPQGILARSDATSLEQEGIAAHPDVFLGSKPSAPVEIVENGLKYWVDPRTGQKTGFYLDQRENRRAVAAYCRGKRVLDLYCYTGSFALNAVRNGGATSVLGFDNSSTAIEVARHHAKLNGLDDSVQFAPGEIPDAIEILKIGQERFDVVICDPPRFAKHPRRVEDGLKTYLRLNRAAIDVLEPGGILATCSCSGLVDRALFADILGQVAEHSGRSIQILEQRGQAPDHPVSVSCLESEYLKCFICRVS